VTNVTITILSEIPWIQGPSKRGGKLGYMLEQLCIRQYSDWIGVTIWSVWVNQQGKLHIGCKTLNDYTPRYNQKIVHDIVWTAWRHADSSRNVRAPIWCRLLSNRLCQVKVLQVNVRLAWMYRKVQHWGTVASKKVVERVKIQCKIWLYAGITLYPTVPEMVKICSVWVDQQGRSILWKPSETTSQSP